MLRFVKPAAQVVVNDLKTLRRLPPTFCRKKTLATRRDSIHELRHLHRN